MPDLKFDTQEQVNEFLREPHEFGESDYLVVALDTATGPTANLEVARQLERFARDTFSDESAEAYDFEKAHIAGIEVIDNPDHNKDDPNDHEPHALSITYETPAPFAAWVVGRK